MVMQDPVTTAAAYAGYKEANPFGGRSSGDRGREQREKEDRRRQINQAGDLDPILNEILNQQFNAGNATPDELVRRYGAVYGAQGTDPANFINQIYGDQDRLNQFAYNTFADTFGRGPTSDEFAQILPTFGGAEGRQRGAAAVSSMFDAYKQSPDYLQTQAGNYSDELDPVFDQLLGRDFTGSELDYYGQQLAGGRSQYEIEQMLRQLPEFQQAEDKKFRTGLASELEGYDTSFFNKAKENVISRSGRNNAGVGTSSALDFALTDLMGQIAEKRGQYLAGISAQQYGGNKEAARQDYTYGRDRYFEDQNFERNRRAQDEDYYRDRSDQDRDYQRQFEDMMRFQNQNRGGGPLHTRDWIGIGLQGANAAANVYGASQYRNPYDYFNQGGGY
jgi:hypothetical protein